VHLFRAISIASLGLTLSCRARDRQEGAPRPDVPGDAGAGLPATPESRTAHLAPPSQSVRQHICLSIDNSEDCARTIEQRLLAQPNLPVHRKDPGTLVFDLQSGKHIVLHDSVTEGTDYVGYSYAGYLGPIHAYLVEVQFYEGGSWVLVREPSGQRVGIAGPPTVAPDSVRFVALSSDLVAHYDPTCIEVWSVQSDTIVLEWSLDLGESAWGPTGATWLSNDSIRIATELAPDISEGRAGPPALVVRAKDGWKLAAAPPVTSN